MKSAELKWEDERRERERREGLMLVKGREGRLGDVCGKKKGTGRGRK